MTKKTLKSSRKKSLKKRSKKKNTKKNDGGSRIGDFGSSIRNSIGSIGNIGKRLLNIPSKDQPSFLGKGSYGCVYNGLPRDTINCKGEPPKTEYVSKVQFTLDSEEEFEKFQQIKQQIDNYEKYFTGPIEICEFNNNYYKLNKQKLKQKCDIFNNHDKSLKVLNLEKCNMRLYDLYNEIVNDPDQNKILDFLNKIINVLEGLQKLLEKGFIHNDIKFDNIMIKTDGTFTIIDFGLCKSLNENIEKLENNEYVFIYDSIFFYNLPLENNIIFIIFNKFIYEYGFKEYKTKSEEIKKQKDRFIIENLKNIKESIIQKIYTENYKLIQEDKFYKQLFNSSLSLIEWIFVEIKKKNMSFTEIKNFLIYLKKRSLETTSRRNYCKN